MLLAEQFLERFAGLEKAHGVHVPEPNTAASTKKKGKSWTEQGPATVALWEKHFAGKIGLGVSPLHTDGTCHWAALDIDDYALNHSEFEHRCQSVGLPAVLCKTKSGGIHALVFFSESVPAKLVRSVLSKFAAAVGYGRCEIFPKQTEIKSDTDFGNWLNMPYFGEKTTRFAFVDGKQLSPEEFLELASEKELSLEDFQNLEPILPDTGQDFSDAPPCLEHYIKTAFPPGSMNNALFSMGVYARRKFPENWEEKVFEYNEEFMGPGTRNEVLAIIKSLQKKSYIYKCNDQPLSAHCDKKTCYNRTFGIPRRGRPPGSDKDDRPCILDEVDKPVREYRPAKNSGDEPHWIFTIGGRQLEVTLDMVLKQDKFIREFARVFSRLILQVPEPRWAECMNELLASAEQIELPNDAGPEGQFWLHLEAFCTGHFKGEDQAELLLGRPWTGRLHPGDPDERTWFQSKALMKHFDINHFRKFTEAETWRVLRRFDALHRTLTIKGKSIGVWGVLPFAEQQDDLEPVAIPTEEAF